MNIAQAKCIPIVRYLERQGHQPAKTRQGGQELWYHSPIRDGDENPSFKVDATKNLWFDHGAARGGTIIELVQDLCSCSVRDALHHLDGTGLYSPAYANRPKTVTPPRSKDGRAALRAQTTQPAAGEKEKTEPLELLKSEPLRHPALLQYLTKRGIDHDIARKYVSQIEFKGRQSAGVYFAVGYPAGGGMEARNALFKGYVGTGKSVTFHDRPGNTDLLIFEGFMDFLTYLTSKGHSQADGCVLVLNSTNLYAQMIPYIEGSRFKTIRAFLDNDSAGDVVTEEIITRTTTAEVIDERSRYKGHKDLNAWHMARNK